MNRLLLALVSLGAIVTTARADLAADALRMTKIDVGLAVHLGTTDGQVEMALADTGRMLVHGLALDDVALVRSRTAIQQRGLYPLASVTRVSSLRALPYADNMANLLIARPELLKDVPRDEIVRVLAPGGAAYLGGEVVTKPRPAGMDDWGHFDHGPDGNGVSHDTLVRQPNQIQWVSGVKSIALGGNPAGYDPGAGVRVAGGRICIDYNLRQGAEKRASKSMLACFDAFSGVPLWKIPRDSAVALRRWQLVNDGPFIYTFLQKGGPLVAIDARTGQIARTFADAVGNPLPDEATQVRVGGDCVVVNIGTGLLVLDNATAKLRWKLAAAGLSLLFPSLDVANKRVYVAEADPKPALRSRWPWATVKAVLCLDLESGKQIWRNEDVAGKPVGQLIAVGDHLALFCGSAIGGRGEGGWIGSIRVKDNKLVGEGTFKVAWNDSMYNAVVRDGRIYYAGHTTIYQTPLDRIEISKAASQGYNQRCNRFAATDDLFIWGYVTYLDKAFNGTLQSVCRSGCALGATPANGMVYFTPSACGCFTQIRGYNCMTSEPLRAAVPDDQRLVRVAACTVVCLAGASPAAAIG